MTSRLERLLNRMENEVIRSILNLEDAKGRAFVEQYVDPTRETIAKEVVQMEEELRKCREGR